MLGESVTFSTTHVRLKARISDFVDKKHIYYHYHNKEGNLERVESIALDHYQNKGY